MMEYLPWIIPFVVAILCYLYLMPRIKYRSVVGIDGPNLSIFKTRVENDEELSLRNHLELATQHPKMYKSWNYSSWPTIYVNSPALIKQILQTTSLPSGRSYMYMKKFLGKGLSSLVSKEWKVRRDILVEGFHEKLMRHFLRVVNAQTKNLLSHWDGFESANLSLDLGDWCSRLSADIIMETSCSKPINAVNHSDNAFYSTLTKTYELMRERIFETDLQASYNSLYYLTSKGKLFIKNCTFLRQTIRATLETRRRASKRKIRSARRANRVRSVDSSTDDEGDRIDLLEFLSSQPIGDQEILDELCHFIYQGHRPNGTAIMWTLYLVSQHPDVEERLLEEINTTLGNRDEPSYGDLKNMTYLSLVLKESLRMFPPVAVIDRVLTKSTDLGGHEVRSGVELCILPWVVHRNPKLWEDPDVFNPDRFSLENSHGREHFSYLAFSAGARNCVAQPFVFLMVKAAVAMILKQFRLKYEGEEEPKLIADLVTWPSEEITMSVMRR